MNFINSSISTLHGLQPDDIKQLSPEQMQQFLLSLQRSIQNEKGAGTTQSNIKTKSIHKSFRKRQLKKYINAHIHSAVGRTLERIHIKNGGKYIEQIRKHVKEEKQRLEQSQQFQSQPKVKNFNSNIPSALLDTNSDQLSCPICLELLICPALTACGHAFCLQCLDQSLLFAPTCPNCRESIKGCEPVLCPLLEHMVKLKVSLQNEKEQTNQAHYDDRMAKLKNWKADRFINSGELFEGQLVDVRDTEQIWCQGTIIKVYNKMDHNTRKEIRVAVLVHFNRWNKLYNEIIELPSIRLAPFNCFSGRVDIPRYNLADPFDNMRGSLINGPPHIQQHPANFFDMDGNDDDLSESELEQEEQELIEILESLEEDGFLEEQDEEQQEGEMEEEEEQQGQLQQEGEQVQIQEEQGQFEEEEQQAQQGGSEQLIEQGVDNEQRGNQSRRGRRRNGFLQLPQGTRIQVYARGPHQNLIEIQDSNYDDSSPYLYNLNEQQQKIDSMVPNFQEMPLPESQSENVRNDGIDQQPHPSPENSNQNLRMDSISQQVLFNPLDQNFWQQPFHQQLEMNEQVEEEKEPEENKEEQDHQDPRKDQQ